MKFDRFFMSATVALAAMAVMSPAQAKVDHEVSGHALTRMSFNDNNTTGDTNAMESWWGRVRLNMDFSASNSLKVRIAPQFTHLWSGTGSADLATGFTAREAWFSWSPNNMVTMWAGRQQWAYGNELIWGTNTWNANTISHDALRFRFDFDMGMADLFYSKQLEGTGADGLGTGRDTDVFGMYATFDKIRSVKAVDAYAIWNDAKNATTANRARFGTFGTRIGVDFNSVDVGAELAMNVGKVGSTDIKGLMMDAQLGFNWMDNRVGFGLNYANTEFQTLFPSTHRSSLRAHRYLGDAQLFTMNNITAVSILTNWGISKQFEASVDGWYFMANKSSANAGGLATGTSGKSGLGMELDAALSYSPVDLLDFNIGWAMFKTGDAIKNSLGGNEMIHRMYLEGMVKF